MEYKLKTLDEAILEVQEAIDWYTDIDIDLSLSIEQLFLKSLNEIAIRPLTNPKTKYNFRKYKLARFPYNVVYRLKGISITVVAFAHNKRKPNYWKKR